MPASSTQAPPHATTTPQPPRQPMHSIDADLFQRFFDEAAVGLAHVALDGSWLRVNRTLCTILGYTAEELLASSFQAITHPDDLAEDLAYVGELLRGKRPSYAMRKRYLRRGGQTVWAKLTVSLILDNEGEPLCFLSVIEDISALVEAEAALRRSEERYRSVVEDQIDLICRYTLDLTLTFVNEPYAKLRGKRPEELIGKNLLAGLPVAYHDAIRANIKSLSITNPTVFHENPWLLPDGTLRWFRWADCVVLDDQGQICAYQGVGHDITERKVAEAAEREQRLLAEKEQIEAILNYSPNAKFLLDLDFYIQRTNQVVHQLLGYLPTECLSQSFFMLVSPEDIQCVQDGFVLATTNSEVQNVEMLAKRNDGTTFPAELSIGRSKSGYVCTLNDITERKAYERSLQYQAGLQAHVRDAVIVKDSEMRIQSWNRAAEEIYGWRAEEVMGKPIHEVIVSEESEEERDHNLQRLYEQGWWRGEVRQRRKDGKLLHVLRSVAVLKDTKDKPYGVVTVNHDVSALHEAREKEQELAQLRARMAAIERERELIELKQRFVYMASHEFRTPLATIHALAETLSAYRERMSNEQVETRLEKIRAQTNYLTTVIEDILQLASLEGRKAEFQPTLVNLYELCRTAIAEFQNGEACNHTIELAWHADDESVLVPLVRVDEKMMLQVVTNLLTNAVKYSALGTTVSVCTEFAVDTVTVSVRDQGMGIPAADIKHLFEPFHRAQNAETIRGTGLGLTIVKEAVELHNGIVTVKSELNVGTTFYVTLPR